MMFHTGEIFLHFQPDFSSDVLRPAEIYLGGVEYQGRTPEENYVRVYIQKKIENSLRLHRIRRELISVRYCLELFCNELRGVMMM